MLRELHWRSVFSDILITFNKCKLNMTLYCYSFGVQYRTPVIYHLGMQNESMLCVVIIVTHSICISGFMVPIPVGYRCLYVSLFVMLSVSTK